MPWLSCSFCDICGRWETPQQVVRGCAEGEIERLIARHFKGAEHLCNPCLKAASEAATAAIDQAVQKVIDDGAATLAEALALRDKIKADVIAWSAARG